MIGRQLRLLYKCKNCGSRLVKVSENEADQRYVHIHDDLEDFLPHNQNAPMVHKCTSMGFETGDKGFYTFVGFRIVECDERAKEKA